MADIIDLIIKSKEAPKEKNVLWLDTNDYTTKIYGNGGWIPLGGNGGGSEGITIDLGEIDLSDYRDVDITELVPQGYVLSGKDTFKFKASPYETEVVVEERGGEWRYGRMSGVVEGEEVKQRYIKGYLGATTIGIEVEGRDYEEGLTWSISIRRS